MPKPQYPWSLKASRPIISGFYPDPSIVRVGDTYYLANSTFEYAPGVPIHESKDLINWSLAGHALHSTAQLKIDGQMDSKGIFAPTIRYHDGKFYLITTLMDGNWQLLVSADSIVGPWSEAIRINVVGIDPDLFWDENGDCYMTYAAMPLGGIGQVRIDVNSGESLGEPYLVWQGNGGKFPEGPHIYKIDDWYYLLIAEGGTERGHAVSVARAREIIGPFESDPRGILLSNRGTDYPLQNVGHGDLVQQADDTWAMVFHGTRPRGSSPEWHVLGRETCAVQIEWVDGWPTLGEPIEPSSTKENLESLTKSSNLPADWISPGSWPTAEQTSEGILVSGFVARRQLSHYFELDVELAGEGIGGVAVYLDSRHKLELLRDSERAWAQWTIGDKAFEIGSISGQAARLRVVGEPMVGHFSDPLGPDRISLFVILTDGSEHEVASLDGRYLSTEVAGGFTGRVLGVVAQQPQLIQKWEYRSVSE